MSEDKAKQMISNLRVLDESAFTELAGKLDSLIAQAASSGRELDGLFNKAETVNAGAHEVKSELDKRLVLSARVLKITKEQLHSVEQAVNALSARQSRVDELSNEVQGQLTDFHKHLGEAVSKVDGKVNDAVRGLDEQRRTNNEDRDRADRLIEAATKLTERCTQLQEQLTTGTQRFEEGLGRALADMQSGRSAADRASSKLDEQVFALKSRVTAFADGIEEWLRPALSKLEETRQDSGDAKRALQEQFDLLTSRLDDAVRRLDERIHTGLADLRSDGDAQPDLSAADLADLKSDIRDAVASLERRSAELSDQTVEAVKAAVAPLSEQTGGDGHAEIRDHIQDAVRTIEDRLGTILVATEKVQEGMAAALAERAHAPESEGGGDEQLAALTAGHEELKNAVANLGEEIGSVGSRIKNVVEPVLASLQLKDGEADAGGDGDLQAKLDALLEQFDQRLAEVVAGLDRGDAAPAPAEDPRIAELAGGQEQVLANIERLAEQVSALDGRLDGEVAPALARIGEKGGGPADGAEERLADLQANVAEVLTAIDTIRRREGLKNNEAVATIGELTANQEKIQAALERIENQAPAPAGDGGTTALDTEVHQRLTDLSEKLSAVGARIKNVVEPVLASLQLREGESGVGQALADLQDQVASLSDKLGQGSAAGASPGSGGGAVLDEKLLMRLDEKLSAVLAHTATDNGSVDAAPSPAIERDLQSIKDMLAGVAGRLDDHTDRLQDSAAPAGDLTAGLGRLREHVDARLNEILAGIGSGMPGGDGSGPSPELLESHERLLSAMERLEEKLSGAPAFDGPADPQAPAALERDIISLKELLAGIAGRLDEQLERAPEPGASDPGLGGSISELREHVDDRLTEVLKRLDAGASAGGEAPAAADELLSGAIGRLEEHLSAVTDKMETALAQKQQSKELEKSLADLQSQLAGIPDAVEQRVAAALRDLEVSGNGGATPRVTDGATSPQEKRSGPAPTQPKPKSPKGFVTALIDAINTGDERAIRRFIGTTYSESALQERSIEDRVEVYVSFHEEVGTLTVCHIESTDEQIVAVVQEAQSPQRHRITLTLDSTPPHLIYLVNIDTL